MSSAFLARDHGFNQDNKTLGLFSEDGTPIRRGFEYHLAGVEPAPVSLSKDQLPWYIAQLMQGKLVEINRLEDLQQALPLAGQRPGAAKCGRTRHDCEQRQNPEGARTPDG